MPLATPSSFLGIAKEATKGTAVAATDYIPMRSWKLSDVTTWIDDDGMRGAAVDVYNTVAGPAETAFEGDGQVYADSIGYWLGGLLGDVATAGGGAPFTHTMAVKNSTDMQPVAWSLSDFYGLSGGTPDRRYAGVQIAELAFKWDSAGALEYSVKGAGHVPSALVAKPTSSFGTLVPLPTWLVQLSIAGGSKLFMEGGELSLKRSFKVIHTGDNSAGGYATWVGPLAVDGKFTFVHEDDTEFTRFTGATTAILVLNWTRGGGAATEQVQFTMSKAQYKAAVLDRSADYVKCAVDFKALANTTDVGVSGGYSPIKVILQNAKASGTYQ